MTPSKILLSLVAIACVSTLSNAKVFTPLGAKAAAMGGAGVALSPASLAAYNNPALLAYSTRSFEANIGVGVGVKDTGAFSSASKLGDLNFDQLADKDATQFTQEDIDTIKTGRDIIVGMDGEGFILNPAFNIGLSFGSFGTGLFTTTEAMGLANVDQTRTQLIWKDDSNPATEYYNLESGSATATTQLDYDTNSLQAAIEDGSTSIDVAGIAIAEIPLAYGHAFDTGAGSFSIGGTAKLMRGETFFKKVKFNEDGDAGDDLSKNQASSTTFGVDAGLAFKPDFASGLVIGLVGKNLNSPEFDFAQIAKADGYTTYTVDPSFRAGVAYSLGEWLEIAADMDLTEVESFNGFKTQNIGGGVNFDLSFLELSAGLMKNISDNQVETGLLYTAGIATGPDWLHFELAGQYGSETITVDGEEFANQFGIMFAISSAW